MAIDAIVANMDSVWAGNHETLSGQPTRSCDLALERFLKTVKDRGYALFLMSSLESADLNRAINAKLGDDGANYFSSILPSKASPSVRYAVALHTLGTQADRIIAVGASSKEREEARDSGITQWVNIEDAISSDADALNAHG
jgi:hypothetical protein